MSGNPGINPVRLGVAPKRGWPPALRRHRRRTFAGDGGGVAFKVPHNPLACYASGMRIIRRVGPDTSIVYGGCLPSFIALIVLAVASMVVAGSLLWLAAIAAGAFAAWVVLWVMPMSVFRVFTEDYSQRVGVAATVVWFALVVALTAWIL